MLKKGFYTTAFNLTVLVTGLGYFIDTFDFFLFNCVRVQSLSDLGLSGDALTRAGIHILNAAIFGALIGSFVWGVLGDRIGRKKALLASIFIYSFGMVGTAFVQSIPAYTLIRFIVGFGLAGEIGLGATLVAETVKPSQRTLSLAFFTVMGALGVAFAAIAGDVMGWRATYAGGGVLGFLLLILRGVLIESQMFEKMAKTNAPRGSLRELLCRFANLKKFVFCFLVLMPNYFVTGLLLTLSPEIGLATGAQGTIKGNFALGIYFVMAAIGSLLAAILSEKSQSRRFVAALNIMGNLIMAIVFVQKLGLTVGQVYALCAAFGLFNLWSISTTITVEQFPTHLRATATTANLSCARAGVIAMNLLLLAFKPYFGLLGVLLMISTAVTALGLFAVWRLPESYARSLAE